MSKVACKAVLSILGMRDNTCRERVAIALGEVEGVREVSVSLIRARAVVLYSAPCRPGVLARAVRRAGFRVFLDAITSDPS